MIKQFFLLVGIAALVGGASAIAASPLSPMVIKRGADWVGPAVTPELVTTDLRHLPPAKRWHVGLPVVDAERDLPPYVWPGYWKLNRVLKFNRESPEQNNSRAPAAFGTPLLNVPGINFTGIHPADPTGDVGLDHYVQGVNNAIGFGALYQVFDKATGAAIGNAFSLSGNNAQNAPQCRNSTVDPIVTYDNLANRWILLEYALNNDFCLYVSSSSNPVTSTWVRYGFTLPLAADFPKLMVWPSGYAVAVNTIIGTPPRQRPIVLLDRNQVLAGNPVTPQLVLTAGLDSTSGLTNTTPVQLKGFNAPPDGAPMLFVNVVDDDLVDPPPPFDVSDLIVMWSVVPDFVNPANTTVTRLPDIVTGAFNFLQSAALPQPGGDTLSMINGVPSNRVMYRNMGTHESIVIAHTISTTLGTPPNNSINWFELRRTGGINQPWILQQDGFYQRFLGGGSGLMNVFMPTIGIDNGNNLALAYGVLKDSNPAIYPGLRYTGRLAGDFAGAMTMGEVSIAEGTASQPSNSTTASRWGDYFDLALDPDGCRFWVTGQYMDDATWGTRIAAIRHDQCGAPDFSLTTPAAPMPEVCLAGGAQNINPIGINVGTSNAFWRDVNLTTPNLPTGVSAVVQDPVRRPPASTNVSINVGTSAVDGINTVSLRGASTDLQNAPLTHDLNLSFDVDHAAAAVPQQVTPADAATQVNLLPTISWNGVNRADRYVLEVSTSNTFATLLINQTLTSTSFIPFNVLSANTTYFWRVKSQNQCGDSVYSAVRSFTTRADFCTTPIVPTTVPDNGNLVRNITTTGLTGDIAEMNAKVVLINGRGGDYRITLSNGTQSAVLLNPLGASCTTGSFRFVFDDNDAANVGCSDFGTTSDSVVKPNNPLAVFTGTPANATWTLTIDDTLQNGVTGQYLFFCVNPTRTQTNLIFGNGFE